MIDWLTILLALGITGGLVGIFAFMAWKINVSDPLSSDLLAKKDQSHGLTESSHSRKKKDKSSSDGKKKRKDAKKSRTNNRNDDEDRHSVTFKEPTPIPSDESDNDQEESEQGSITPPVPSVQIVGVTLALSKRQKKRNRQTHSPSHPAGPVEGILINRDEKSPVTDHPQPIPHPKLATMIPKDEVELAKLHHQTKSNQSSTKSAQPAKKSAATNDTPRLQHQEQPFTVVNNRHKSGVPSAQQQQQQQQAQQQPQPQRTKLVVAAAAPVPPPLASTPGVPTPAPVVQQEPLAQRQTTRQQKEVPPTPVNGFNNNNAVNKQSASSNATAAPPMKITDMFKALPTSQAVVCELMLALDAYPLSADELNIVMHKIANKQAVINKDWTKLQHGQKVDPQAHMGQMIDESAKACEEDLRTNATKHFKDLGDALNVEKRRIQDLLHEKDDKEKTIQSLRNQLDGFQHQHQNLQLQIHNLTEENIQLNKRSTQHFQQPQAMNTNDSTNAHIRLLREQIEKVSVKNGEYEKKIKANEALIEKYQKEKDDLIRSTQKLTQRAQQHQQNEDKLAKELNELRTLHSSQINDFKNRLEQYERENEQLRQVQLQAAAAPTTNNDEREQFERNLQQLNDEIQEQKKKFDDLQNRFHDQENLYKHEINQQNESLAALRSQLEESRSTKNSADERLEQERNKFKTYLVDLLTDDARANFSNDQQDDEQWLSSYRQIFEIQKKNSSEEANNLKLENDQLHQKMKEIESELKDIEKTVQAKEETLLKDLRERDGTISSIQQENDRLRHEVHRLQTDHDSAANEIRSLKDLLEGRVQLVNQHFPSTVTTNTFDVNESNASSDQQQHEQHQSES